MHNVCTRMLANALLGNYVVCMQKKYLPNLKKLEEIIDKLNLTKSKLGDAINVRGLKKRKFLYLFQGDVKLTNEQFAMLADQLNKIGNKYGRQFKIEKNDLIKNPENIINDLRIQYADKINEIRLSHHTSTDRLIYTKTYINRDIASSIKYLFESIDNYISEATRWKDDWWLSSAQDMYNLEHQGIINSRIENLKNLGVNCYCTSLIYNHFATDQIWDSSLHEVLTVKIIPSFTVYNLWVFCSDPKIKNYKYEYMEKLSYEDIRNLTKHYPCEFIIHENNPDLIVEKTLAFYKEKKIDKKILNNFDTSMINFSFPKYKAALIPIYEDKHEQEKLK